MNDFNASTLKADAEAHLRTLRISDRIPDKQREIVVLAMCSFACKITLLQIEELVSGVDEPVP